MLKSEFTSPTPQHSDEAKGFGEGVPTETPPLLAAEPELIPDIACAGPNGLIAGTVAIISHFHVYTCVLIYNKTTDDKNLQKM